MSNAEIGARLRLLRGDTPRQEVADAVGVSISALQMYENGARIPRDQTKMALARYYKTSVESIFLMKNRTIRAELSRKLRSQSAYERGKRSG